VLEYRVRADGWWLTCAYTRSRQRPWPLAGGGEGSDNFVEVVRGDGSRERYAVATMIPLAEGDVVRITTASGAGYGNPRERPRELVLADVRAGLLDDGRARDVYGISA
jgi:N-methylhydantoinase B